MVLAAGLGTRMRPLTDETPKPLLRLCDRSLLHHAMDRLRDAGIGKIVVNAYWFADQVVDAVAAHGGEPAPVVLRESALLDRALRHDATAPLRDFLDAHVPPALRANPASLREQAA